MAVDQLPGQVREFANYLGGVLGRLDQGSGWCAVFWQRDPDGMQACLDGREVPPWDVVESLLQDLSAEYGPEVARAEAERARTLHAGAQSAHDRRPGGRDALGDRFDVMLREQRYAAERQAELGRLLATAATRTDADAIRLDLAWSRDDHERAVRRCAELQSRMAELDRHRSDAERAQAIRRGPLADGRAFREAYGGGGRGDSAWGDVREGAGAGRGPGGYEDGGQGSLGHEAAVHGGGDFPDMPQQRDTHSAAGAIRSGHTPQWSDLSDTPHPRTGGHPQQPTDANGTAYTPAGQAPATSPDRPHRTDAAAQPPEAPAPAPKQRKRRRGSARFAGMAEQEAAPVVVPPTAVPDLPAAPAARGRTLRGARFAGAADAGDVRPPARGEPVDVADGAAARETADTVVTLVRLRSEGRTGEAHALLVEVAHWPAARFPLLAAELKAAGLGADWASLLWEAASLPADRLVAAADALVAAGRGTDGEQVLRQGVARPAGEIGEAVLGLVAEGRRREVSALLDAYVRVRTPEEAARSAEPDPGTLVPLLLAAARGVSDERHWDLVHALRVAGFSA
ncbi:hypothetical protein AB0D34_18130 [Streptomyces sp. NPDC048420]|uniref:hypothetical protein n=1 Tax=Streptomyces sp. NPDC048420 TaxID=3155755 RepID=UPI003418A0F7